MTDAPPAAVSEADTSWYDVQGRRMGERRPPGIYFRRGRRLISIVLLSTAANQVTYPAVSAATTYYVNYDTGNDGTGDGSIGLPWKQVSKANSTVPAYAGHTVMVAASATQYDALPNVGGTTFIGDTAAWHKVKVPGGNITKRQVTLEGFRVNGTIAFTEPTGGQAHVRKCLLYSGVDGGADSVRIDSNIIGNDSTSCSVHMRPNVASRYRDVITNNVMHLRGSLAGAGAYQFEMAWIHPADTDCQTNPGNDADTCGLRLLTVSANKCTMTVTDNDPSGDFKATMINRMQWSTWNDNVWYLQDSCTTCPTTMQGWLWRDKIRHNLETRDTVIVKPMAGCTGCLMDIDLLGSGNTSTHDVQLPDGTKCPTGCKDSCESVANSWRSNFYKLSGGGRIYTSRGLGPWDSLSYCVFAESTNVGYSQNFETSRPWHAGPVYIYRNTFSRWGNNKGPAFWVDTDNCTDYPGTMYFYQNIVRTYETQNDSTGYNFAMRIVLPIAQAARWHSDYNLYFRKNGTNGGARSELGDGSCTSTSDENFGPGSYPCTGGTHNECHSLRGSPKFADSTFANFNPQITAGSWADGRGSCGSDIGATDLNATTASGISAISNFTTRTVGFDDAVLQWTVPSGGACGGVVAYEMRYSTSPITEINFSSATLAPSAPPVVLGAGATQSFHLLGLNADTFYYTAIRYRVIYGTASPIATTSFRTTTEGP